MSSTMCSQKHFKSVIKKTLSHKVHDVLVPPNEYISYKTNSLLSNVHFLYPSDTRKLQVFCVGLPRSGTHSLAYMFDKNYQAEHEPLTKETIINILRWKKKRISRLKMKRLIAFRDKKLRLNVEASHYLHHIVDLLVELFPKAKFILTVREPLSWLESEVNQNYCTRNLPHWTALEQYRYARYDFPYQYSSLEQSPNLYPIQAYLTYWKNHVKTVFHHVPKERLLVLDTFNLSQSTDIISSFAGIDPNLLDIEKQWSGKRNTGINLYDLVDRGAVQDEVEMSCRKFIEQQLPFLMKYQRS